MRSKIMSDHMPVTVQPGVAALMALIKHDETFALDLKRGVIAQVVRGLMPKDIEEVYVGIIEAEVRKVRGTLIEQLGREGKTLDQLVKYELDKAMASIRSSYYTYTLPEKSDGAKKLQAAAADVVAFAVRRAVDSVLSPDGAASPGDGPVKVAFEKRSAEIEARINGSLPDKIEKLLDERIDARIEHEVESRVAARLAAIRNALAG
jgi:hypothetical protein